MVHLDAQVVLADVPESELFVQNVLSIGQVMRTHCGVFALGETALMATDVEAARQVIVLSPDLPATCSSQAALLDLREEVCR